MIAKIIRDIGDHATSLWELHNATGLIQRPLEKPLH